MVDLIEEILDNDGVLGLGELEPFVKARRRVASAALAIGLSSLLERLGLLRKNLGKVELRIVYELVNRMTVFRAGSET